MNNGAPRHLDLGSAAVGEASVLHCQRIVKECRVFVFAQRSLMYMLKGRLPVTPQLLGSAGDFETDNTRSECTYKGLDARYQLCDSIHTLSI